MRLLRLFPLLVLIFSIKGRWEDKKATSISAPTYKFSATAKDTTTEVFSNRFGGGSLTFTETYTLVSVVSTPTPTPSCYVGLGACGSHTVSLKSTSTSSNSNQVTETIWATNISTASISVPVTSTTTLPASTLTITVSAAKSSGYCYWGQNAVLTPCSNIVQATSAADGTASATQKSAARSIGTNNVFKPILAGFKKIFSHGFGSRSNVPICHY
jgi:hypothetical protein